MTLREQIMRDHATASAAALAAILAQYSEAELNSEVTLTSADEPPQGEPPAGEPPQQPEIPEPRVFLMAVGNPHLSTYEWHWAERYLRMNKFEELGDDPVETIDVILIDFGGGRYPLPFGRYDLYMDGELVSWYEVNEVDSNGIGIIYEPTGEPRWVMSEVVGPNGLRSVPMWHFVNPGGGPIAEQPAWMPVWNTSHDVVHKKEKFTWAKVPARFTPTVRPLPPREFPPLGYDAALMMHPDKKTREDYHAELRNRIYRTNLVPSRTQSINRPNLTKNGIMTGANRQGYFHADYEHHYPRLAVLDGPRGHGTMSLPTHISIDRHGGAIVCESHSVRRVDLQGNIRTRAGYRHNKIPGQYELPVLNKSGATWDSLFFGFAKKGQYESAMDVLEEVLEHQRIELVGNWEGCPRWYRRFHETWGMAFLASTLVLDENGEPIGGEQPHLFNPVQLMTSSQLDCVHRLEYVRDSFEAVPTVTLFAAELAHPFDVVAKDGFVYISERDGNRIGRWREDGTFDQYVISTPMPEGLYILGDWLYFSTRQNITNAFIKRLNLMTGTVETCFPISLDTKARFIKFSVDDGSFAPEGTVYYQTWMPAYEAAPRAVLPSGHSWLYELHNGARPCGRGPSFYYTGFYGTASAVKMGRLIYGAAVEGLVMISAALESDPVVDDERFARGMQKFSDRGYRLLYGEHGFDFTGEQPPAGEDEDIDYYLAHARG